MFFKPKKIVHQTQIYLSFQRTQKNIEVVFEFFDEFWINCVVIIDIWAVDLVLPVGNDVMLLLIW